MPTCRHAPMAAWAPASRDSSGTRRADKLPVLGVLLTVAAVKRRCAWLTG